MRTVIPAQGLLLHAVSGGRERGVPAFPVRADVYVFWGSLMDACLIMSVPIAIAYNVFVNPFVAGFTAEAIT